MTDTEFELLAHDVEAVILNLNKVIKTLNLMIEAAKNSEQALNDWAGEIERRLKKVESYNSILIDGVEIL